MICNRLVMFVAVLPLVFCSMSAEFSTSANSFETSAKEVVLIDDYTQKVMLSKNSNRPMFPASMSKVMTLFIAFERLSDGTLSMSDKFLVSEKAWRMGGSKMFVEVNTKVTVRDLLYGIIVQSGNDACIVLAEGLAGSEERFVDLMNATAQTLGMSDSHFKNVTGWPHNDHYTTASDLATLAHSIIHKFPKLYRLFQEKSFTYNGIKQGNRNPLLYTYSGTDGLKTGHTKASGYGLMASVVRDKRRIILVANGMGSVNGRARETERLLDYGFREFSNFPLFKAGEEVDKMEVWLGDTPDEDSAGRSVMPVVIEQDLVLTMSHRQRKSMKIRLIYPGPIPAPIEKGSYVGTLIVNIEGEDKHQIPIVAGVDVKALPMFRKIGAAFSYLIWGE